MKLAIIGDEISQDLDVVLSAICDVGFEGLEIRSVWETPPHQLTADQLAQVRMKATHAAVSVVGFNPPACKAALPEDDVALEEQRHLLQQSIDAAVLLGADFVRCFSFYRQENPDPAAAARVFTDVLEDVDRRGVRLLVETGTRTNTPTVRLLLDFLERVGDSGIGALWDPGNSIFSGWATGSVLEEYELGRGIIQHVHVKDPQGTAQYVRLGDGDVGWPRLLQVLAEDGYDGWLSLETHWRLNRVLDQPQRDEPWGSEFSDGGLGTSVACMQLLRKMVELTR